MSPEAWGRLVIVATFGALGAATLADAFAPTTTHKSATGPKTVIIQRTNGIGTPNRRGCCW